MTRKPKPKTPMFPPAEFTVPVDDASDLTHLGMLIARLRERKRLSREELAQEVGVIPTTIQHLEQGTLPLSIDLLSQIFSVLGYSLTLQLVPTIDELLYGEDGMWRGNP